MSIRILTAVMASVALALPTLVSTTRAAPVCGPRDKVVAELGERYQENRKSLGLAGGAAVIELYVSSKGSWTLVSTDTKGKACVLAAGQAWQDAPRIVAGQDV
jgi:hypothetical protein